jgi:hypothetical protein
MDKLDRMIAEKQSLLETLQKQIEERAARHERLLIELEVLKEAAKARPAAAANSQGNGRTAKKSKERGASRKGRQPGDISLEWRRVLGLLYSVHRRLSYVDIHNAATHLGIETQMPNVRERVRSMVENGLMTGTPEQGFLVSKEAVTRFGLQERTDDTAA